MLGPNILSILFLNTLNLCSSLRIRDQIVHQYKTGKIIVLDILKFGNLCSFKICFYGNR